jgi:ribosome biogenesis GTPase / thiamine phosphate phosphatase
MTFSPIWTRRLVEPNHGRTALSVLGWSDEWESVFKGAAIDSDGAPARVVRHDGVKVLVSDGDTLAHITFPRSMALAVGDWVVVADETVCARLDRSTVLERDIGDDGTQVIAANIDTVLVVFGVDRPLRRRKVLRFLAFAWDIGAEPMVLLSKSDLVDDTEAFVDEIRSWGVDVPILPVSVENAEGLDDVLHALTGRTGTLIGESGAGKSSLVNAMMQDEVAWVGDVRSRDQKGRHTTTHRELHLLPHGGMVIDNPGVRSLGLAGESEGVEQLFNDIDELASDCRFRDCSHRSEPGCAVAGAVMSGELAQTRLDSYLQFVAEQAAASQRGALKSRRSAQKQSSASAKKAMDAIDDRDV